MEIHHELNSYTGNGEHLPATYEGFHNSKHTEQDSENLNCHLHENRRNRKTNITKWFSFVTSQFAPLAHFNSACFPSSASQPNIAQVLLTFLLLSQLKLLNMKYFRPVGNKFCHFKSKHIATKWNGPQNSCLPVFANCHSKILKFSAQRKFGTLTNSKTYNFTDPRPYFKSSKKTTPVSFSLKEKKPILWTAKKMQSNHNYLPQIVSSKKKLQVEIPSSSQSSFFLFFFFLKFLLGPTSTADHLLVLIQRLLSLQPHFLVKLIDEGLHSPVQLVLTQWRFPPESARSGRGTQRRVVTERLGLLHFLSRRSGSAVVLVI